MRHSVILAAALALAGCGRSTEPKQPHVDRPAVQAPAAANKSMADSAEQQSPEAAAQLVQSYGALIEQKRWPEANALWTNAKAARKVQAELAPLTDLHFETGNVGDEEGAAGSIYVAVPVIVDGDAADGQPYRRSGDAALRRINDVPGSTEDQRRWHIERIDWAG